VGVRHSGSSAADRCVPESSRGADHRHGLRRRLSLVAVAAVVVLAGMVGTALPAAAEGPDTALGPDTAGNYAECNVNYTVRTHDSAGFYSDGFTDSTSGGTDSLDVEVDDYADAMLSYEDGISWSATCNLAGDTGQSISIHTNLGENAYSNYANDPVDGDGTSTFGGVGESEWYGEVVTNGCYDDSVTSWSGWSTYSATRTPSLCSHLLWSCSVSFTGHSGSTPCGMNAVSVADTATDPAPEPGVYWAGSGESPVLPAPGPPVTDCTIALNPSSGYVVVSGTPTEATGDTGDTITVSVDWGDSGTDATSLPATHTYDVSAEAAEGWTLTVTTQAVGDGVHETGTTSGTCTKTVDTTTTDGSGSTPSDGAPISCSWTDFLCDLKAAFNWAFVPSAGSGFFTAWDSFTSAMTTSAPLGYVTGSVSWASDLFSEFKDTEAAFDGGTGTCRTINVGVGSACVASDTAGGGATAGGTSEFVIQMILEVGICVGFGLVLIAEVRRQLKAK
jgi:hypothetical protein